MFVLFLVGSAMGWFMSIKYEEINLLKKQNIILSNIDAKLTHISNN